MSKILIIEDDAAFCQMLEKFLTKKGYDVVTSFSAVDAKEKIGKSSFDLVLTDLRLPDYDGITLLGDIKEVHSNVPVIVMTGYAEVGTAVEAMKKGAFDYISKPFTPEEIVMVIANALNQKSTAVTAKFPDKVQEKPNLNDVPYQVEGAIQGISE
ncbi:MAG: sigma-54-dependent transcriptional regulator, partial [Flavobacteriales bacterium]